ncbi:tRNA pseudouridine synthase 9 [Trypanosoma rangeli]|uniref:tRNA pseudouridine synthase 9 n=1 Tax=Trypanosoma rangeli TaxID=5698 RepID=A0A3R7NDN7_TRYRA|nr:tRNA pseudouridine synthase 9 [Trypanosoma rangeli]RNF01130.1 tRNA pseudouridine synthase 9 [Trypanosoma rangeli]|eukprot:RNF01130.1 tRNA pseudouridine synthase 9 [Trypanosoma rangeli]
MDAAQLVQLEAEAWASDQQRQLYSTPLIPGFPWYTVAAAASHSVRRHVVPYHYTFRVFVKGRWIGRSLLDIYSEEHTHHSRQYYATCMQRGLLRRQPRTNHNVRRGYMKRSYGVDQPSKSDGVEDVSQSIILERGDLVLHTVHRHEVPVCMGTTGVDPIVLAAVRITAYGLLLIHKPAGVPTHASGRYFMNSCTNMLEYVLAPKRLRAWLLQRDPLLQSLVSTRHLTEEECQELLAYYAVEEGVTDAGECVPIERLPRPCHRLDKVTSGVLLLGVSQAATRRVGEALTRKTKQMEEVFLRQLLGFAADDTNNTRVDGVRTINAKILEEFDVGVRKRYLARVHGCFPNRALHVLSAGGGTQGKDADAQRRSAADDGIFIATMANHTPRHGDGSGEDAVCGVGPPVLLASPLAQLQFRNGDTAEEPVARNDEGKQQREPVQQAAATFCQPLRQFASGSGEQRDEGETLVQCVPFSGRMHQIRIHLSDWGHPIIGDASLSAMEQQQSSLYAPASPHCEGTATHDVESKEGIKLYFCMDDLPAVYREGFHKHDALCWECAGRLPVASFGNQNSSTIALHAWQYEIDHHLLRTCVLDNAAVGTDETVEAKDEKEVEPQNYEQGHAENDGKETVVNLCCCMRDVRRHQDEFVQRRGKYVVFFAPLPAWSLD